MLPTLGAPSKKSTPEQQMAMMRTYLNQLKDDTEGELYNIRWENLAKPLQDKLNGLDKDIVAQGEQFDYLNANMVTVGYLQANYITASQIAANYIATANLEAAVINAGFIKASTVEANYATFNYLATDYVYAGTIQASQIQSLTIAANQITSGTIAAARLDADIIAGRFVSGNTSVFNTMNVGTLPKSNSTSGLRSYAGGGTFANIYRKSTGTPNQYYLVVNYPD